MGYFSLFLISAAIGAACAVVLFRAAKASGRHPIIWGTLGLVFNVFALVGWYVVVGTPPGRQGR